MNQNEIVPPLEEGVPNLNYDEVARNLQIPIPRELISTKDQGGHLIDYVNVTDLKDLMDQRTGLWESSVVKTIVEDGILYIVVRVSVIARDRVISHDGVGSCQTHITAYGDTYTKAYAQGFRRACESHGLGRELWRRENDDYTQDQNQGQNQQRPPQQNQQRPQQIPANPLAKSVSELATPKQVVMIRAICRDLDIDVDIELQETMKLECKVEELSRRAASAFIDHLKQLQEANEIPLVRRSK